MFKVLPRLLDDSSPKLGIDLGCSSGHLWQAGSEHTIDHAHATDRGTDRAIRA
jgi:hypothetical protein